MDSRQLTDAALRVLTGWTYGDKCDDNDIRFLRQHARPDEIALPLDELACRIVARQCTRVIRESKADRKGIESSAPRRRKKVG